MIPLELAFEVTEYEQRVARVQDEMARRGLDGLVLAKASDVYYLSGMDTENHTDPQLVVLGRDRAPILVTGSFERGRVTNSVWLSDVTYYERRSDFIATVKEVLRAARLDRGTVGIEQRGGTLTPADFNALVGEIPDAVVREPLGTSDRARLRKSPSELAYMRQAGRISDVSLAAGGAAMAPGVPDTEIAAAIVQALYRNGSDLTCWGPVVASGYRAGAPHCTFNGRVLEEGDTVFLELTAQRRRYVAPVMSTWVVGRPSSEIEMIFEAGRRAIEIILETARAGVTASSVALAVEAYLLPILDRHRLYTPDRYGYSVGIGFPPSWDEDLGFVIDRDNHEILEVGMTFHLPMSLRRYGEFGVNQSCTVAITEVGAELVTTPPAVLPIVAAG